MAMRILADLPETSAMVVIRYTPQGGDDMGTVVARTVQPVQIAEDKKGFKFLLAKDPASSRSGPTPDEWCVKSFRVSLVESVSTPDGKPLTLADIHPELPDGPH